MDYFHLGVWFSFLFLINSRTAMGVPIGVRVASYFIFFYSFRAINTSNVFRFENVEEKVPPNLEWRGF